MKQPERPLRMMLRHSAIRWSLGVLVIAVAIQSLIAIYSTRYVQYDTIGRRGSVYYDGSDGRQLWYDYEHRWDRDIVTIHNDSIIENGVSIGLYDQIDRRIPRWLFWRREWRTVRRLEAYATGWPFRSFCCFNLYGTDRSVARGGLLVRRGKVQEALMPFTPLWGGLAMNSAMIVVASHFIRTSWRAVWAVQNRRQQCCETCGYSREGNEERCPECGRNHPQQRRQSRIAWLTR